MKMNLKRFAMSALGAMSVTLSASAVADDISIDAAVKANFGAVSPQIKSLGVTLDTGKTTYLKEATGTSNYAVVKLGSETYLVDNDGASLVSPKSAFFVAHGKIMPAAHVFAKYEFDNGASQIDWPHLPVDDGVEKQGTLYVFSDPTCGYCVKVEKEIPVYTANGVEVRYVPWPRSGLQAGTPNYDKWAKATCSSNPGQAYHDITLGKNLSAYDSVELTPACTKIISEGYGLGVRVGVTGTPFMYLESKSGGVTISPGYQPAESLMNSAGIRVKPDGASALLGG